MICTLGIDLGSSGLRAVLMHENGAMIGSAEMHYPTHTPFPGHSEQDPADWITALHRAMDTLRGNHPDAFKRLRGIAVAGHMHGAVLLDKNGAVIRPCIMWNDTRAGDEAAALDALPGVRDISGNIVFAGFTAPKLAWVKTHETAHFAQIDKVLLPAAYLSFYLTREYYADLSDSAGTGWLDTGVREWSAALLRAGNMRRDQMPELSEGTAPAGMLRPELHAQWQTDHPVIVTAGVADNAAAACGIGAVNEGQGFVSLGTSGVILIARNSYTPTPDTAVHTFCHAIPARWYQMGVMLSAGASLHWLTKITGQDPAALTGGLGPLRAAGNTMFLPYASGERTPHNDTQIRGAITGINSDTSVADLTRAVLEGVAFGLKDCADALNAAKAVPSRLYLVGGGSASRYWQELIATVLNIPLVIPAHTETGAALGAARLALCAVTGGRPDDIMLAPEAADTVMPVADLVPAFADQHAKFRAAYTAVRPVSSAV